MDLKWNKISINLFIYAFDIFTRRLCEHDSQSVPIV